MYFPLAAITIALAAFSEKLTAVFKEISNASEAGFDISRCLRETLAAITSTEETVSTVSIPASDASSTFFPTVCRVGVHYIYFT